MDTASAPYKSGFVAVMGRPNVGKSTLINRLLGTKIAAVSPWPQTTRKRQMGILTLENAQVIFVDTPGVHRPFHKLGERMNQEAADVLEECDLGLFLVDASQMPGAEDRLLVGLLVELKRHIPTVMALNKSDLVDEATLAAHSSAYQELLPQAEAIPISATEGHNLDRLVDELVARLPAGDPFFPEEQITDLFEREIAADLIREAVLFHLRDEVPHSVAVRIDEYRERNQEGAYIGATLFVERESQKGIVIGQGGTMLKQIGTAARQQIESMSGRKVYLNLRVKVRKNWRNDEAALRLFGFGGRN
ncbi:MAG TPA: GTPase Era [Dehalococcoidia bacterium]|jgi:GTP-binding protein Era|nr:GTPase Era [Dehalococcoidia bacterium]